MKLHKIWKESVFTNGSKKDRTIKLSKKEIIWPLIVSVINPKYLAQDCVLCSGLDECDYQELCSRYAAIIDLKCERFDFVTKVVFDYEHNRAKAKNQILNFVEAWWSHYLNDFDSNAIDDEIKESLIKVVLSNILVNRSKIESIKSSVKL